MDVGSADHLAQHDIMMHITEQTSKRVKPLYLFDPSIPHQARRTSSHWPAAALMHSWSLLALLTQIDHLLPPHIGYSAV
eukprot:1153057-Pelagomonas_calceolata.AAC.1